MKGDLADIILRLKRALPSGWFPNQSENPDGSVPRVHVTMVGFASVLQPIWTMLSYAIQQTRVVSSSDGWLDLRSWDFFGERLPRRPGELDPSFLARIQERLFEKANTRIAISDAITRLTGVTPRIIEVWKLTDVGVLDGPGQYGLFLDCDAVTSPARTVDSGLRNQFFVEAVLPIESTLGSVAVPAYDAQSYLDLWNAALIDLTPTQNSGRVELEDLLARLKAEGVVAWVKIVEKVN